MCSCEDPQGEVMARAAAAARARRDEGYHCAETVLLSVAGLFSPPGGREPDLPLATGFGGGIARTGRTCGALTGGVLALGYLFGRVDPDDKESYARVAELSRDVLREFSGEFGSTECEDLLGFNVENGRPPEGESARRARCAQYIERAAELFARRVQREADRP